MRSVELSSSAAALSADAAIQRQSTQRIHSVLMDAWALIPKVEALRLPGADAHNERVDELLAILRAHQAPPGTPFYYRDTEGSWRVLVTPAEFETMFPSDEAAIDAAEDSK